MVQPSRSQITGLRVAGGRAGQMGGADKARGAADREPLRTVLRGFGPPAAAVLIPGHRNVEAYREAGAGWLHFRNASFGRRRCA